MRHQGRACRFVILLAMAVGMAACNPIQQETPRPTFQFPESTWGERFSYTFDLPNEKAESGSVPVVIAVVNPFYKEEESLLKTAGYSKVGKGFSVSMGADADKVIIAKGMTTLGPYNTLDDVTYAHKKQASLTLAPRVFLTMNVKYIDNGQPVYGLTGTGLAEYRVLRKFRMKVGGWLTLIMQEPLSAEKMWVKKLELEEKEIDGIDQYKAIPVTQTYTYGLFNECTGTRIVGHNQGELLIDGKIETVADYIKSVYPVVMNKLWTYLSPEELLQLQKQTEEIRKLKRF